MAQRRQGAVHLAEIGHLRHPAVFFRGDVAGRADDGGHRVVHPGSDRPEFQLETGGGGIHGGSVRNVGGDA